MKNYFLSIFGFVKRLPWIMAEHVFSVIILLILIDIFLGGVLFYKYVIYAQNKNFQSTATPIEFKYGDYIKVLGRWEKDAQKLEESLRTNHSTPFSLK